MGFVVRSLDGASSAGEGTVIDLKEVGLYSLRISRTNTGSPTQMTVALRGSIDGVTWTGFADTGQLGATFQVDDKLVRFVRADLDSFSGSGTVSADIAVVRTRN